MMKTVIRVTIVSLVVGASVSANAVTESWKATVVRTSLDANLYGGCIAVVSPGPETQGLPSCTAGFVTMDCEGLQGGSKQFGQNSLGAMQLALVTNTQVKIFVTDTGKINTVCRVKRVDNFAPAG